MELGLEQFIASVEKISDIRNLDTVNPLIFNIVGLDTKLYPVVASVTEPVIKIPINATWVCLNTNSKYYRKALKLKALSISQSSVSGSTILDGSFDMGWTELYYLKDVFSEVPYMDTLHVSGPRGPVGPTGEGGPPGPPRPVDYREVVLKAVQLVRARLGI